MISLLSTRSILVNTVRHYDLGAILNQVKTGVEIDAVAEADFAREEGRLTGTIVLLDDGITGIAPYLTIDQLRTFFPNLEHALNEPTDQILRDADRVLQIVATGSTTRSELKRRLQTMTVPRLDKALSVLVGAGAIFEDLVQVNGRGPRTTLYGPLKKGN